MNATDSRITALKLTKNEKSAIIIAAFDPKHYNDTEPKFEVHFDLKAPTGSCHDASCAKQYILNAETVVHDAIYRDMAQIGGLARKDGQCYKIRSMLNDKGREALQNNASKYMRMQEDLLQSHPYVGSFQVQNGIASFVVNTTLTPSVSVFLIE